MMRRLAALLLSLALLTMVPMAHAAMPAMSDATAMIGNARPAEVHGSPVRCTDGHPCVLGCSACSLAAGGWPRDTLPAISATDTRTITLAGFDLSWRLYRPPRKANQVSQTIEDQLNLKEHKMRKLTLSTMLAALLLASTGVTAFAQDATAPADGAMAGMAGMEEMPGMAGGGAMAGMSGGGTMPMGDMMGMMPMMMAMMMPMDGGAMPAMPGAPAMAQTGDQAGLETKLNLLISSIETLTARIDALEANAAN